MPTTYTLDPTTLAANLLVNDGNLSTGAGTDNSTAWTAFLAMANGTSGNVTQIIVPANCVLAMEIFRLPQVPYLEFICANATNCGFVRKPWDNSSDRETWITNQPNGSTFTGSSSRTTAHLVISGGVFNALGQSDQHWNDTYGWNAGLLLVSLAFDNTSLFTGCNFQYSRTFTLWFLNCSGMTLTNVAVLNDSSVNNTDGLHLNSCDHFTATNCTFTSTGDDAIGLNVEALKDDWDAAQPGGGTAFYSPAWLSSYTGSSTHDITITNCTFTNCVSTIRILSLRNIAISNITITGIVGTGCAHTVIATPFGTNPGTQSYVNIEISEVDITPPVGAIIAEFNGTYTGGLRLNNWRRRGNGNTSGTGNPTWWWHLSTIDVLETTGYVSVIPHTEDGIPIHARMDTDVSTSWDISDAYIVRTGAVGALAEVFACYNGNLDCTMTAGGIYAEAISAIAASGSTGPGQIGVSPYLAAFHAGTDNQFVAPSILNGFPVASVVSSTGTLPLPGTETSTAIWDDAFPGTSFNGRWTGGANNPSGGSFNPADNITMYADAGTGGNLAIHVVESTIATAGASQFASVCILANADATGAHGNIATIDIGSDTLTTGGALGVQVDSASAGYVTSYSGGDFPRGGSTGLLRDSKFQAMYIAGNHTAHLIGQDMTTAARLINGLFGDSSLPDYTANTRYGFKTNGENGGVLVSRSAPYSNRIATPSTVSASSISGAANVTYGASPTTYTANVTGAGYGDGYTRGTWEITGGTAPSDDAGAIDLLSGVYTPPASGTPGKTVILTFTPYLNGSAASTFTLTLKNAGGGGGLGPGSLGPSGLGPSSLGPRSLAPTVGTKLLF